MNNQISKKQFFTLTASFFMGNSLALTGGLSKNEKIGYITVFASFVLFIALCFLYSRLFQKYQSSDLFYISEVILGKVFSKIILLLVLFYSLFTAVISTIEFLFFVELSSDFSLKPVWTALFFSLCILSIFLCGKKALARYSELILPFVLLCMAVILFFGIEKMNPSNLKIENIPETGYIVSNTLMNFLSPFSNILIIYFFTSDMFNHKQVTPSSIKAGFTALLVIAALYLTNLLIIGKNLMSSLYFPTLYTFSVINPSLFTERSETVFFITYIFFDILYTAVAYFTAIECTEKLLPKKNTLSPKRKKVFFIIAALLSFIVMNIKIDINSFYSSFTKIPFILATVTIGIPVILTAASFFRRGVYPPPSNNSCHPQ